MINEYGIALYQSKQYSEALAQFKKATTISPDNAGWWLNVFLACYGLKDVDGCAQAAANVLARDPNRPEARGMIDNMLALFDNHKRSADVNPWLTKIQTGSHLSDSLKAYIQSKMR